MSLWMHIFFAIRCWGDGIGSCDVNKLNKLVRKGSSVMGMELDSVETVTDKMMTGQLKTIMGSPSHPLYAKLKLLRCTSAIDSSSHMPQSTLGAFSYH